MFRCENCESGYSAQETTAWTWCPRCLAKHKIRVPLSFKFDARPTVSPTHLRNAPTVTSSEAPNQAARL